MRLQYQLRQRELRTAALERDAANAQLEALSARLQPHFLFNALNTISSTVYEDPVAADEMIGRLGDLLRHALRTTERQQVSLEEELALLNAYLTFVEARFGDRVRVDIDVDPAVLAIAVPTLLLQPLIENAVQYGAACEHGEAHVLVSITRDGGHLLLIVENDASPLPPLAESRTPARVGTGLATSRDRLRILHGSRASLDTSLANGRFRVTIRVPLHAAERVLPVLMEERASADR